MMQFLHVLQAWVASRRDNETGAVAIEYGLLAGLIALAIVVGAGVLGTGLNTMFTNVGNFVQGLPIP